MSQFEQVCDQLKAEGYQVVAARCCYYGSEDAFFEDKLILSDAELGGDAMVTVALGYLFGAAVQVEESEQLRRRFEEVDLGLDGYMSVVVQGRDGRYAGTRRDELARTWLAHTRLDLAREILVTWSNRRHHSQLVWQEGAKATA